MWVFQIFAVHFLQVDVLCGADEAKCSIEFVGVVGGFCKDVVLCHAARDRVHGLLGEGESSYGIVKFLYVCGQLVEFRCNPFGPVRMVDYTAGNGW